MSLIRIISKEQVSNKLHAYANRLTHFFINDRHPIQERSDVFNGLWLRFKVREEQTIAMVEHLKELGLYDTWLENEMTLYEVLCAVYDNLDINKKGQCFMEEDFDKIQKATVDELDFWLEEKE